MFRLLAESNTNAPTIKTKREFQITFKFLDLQLRLSNAYLEIIKVSQDAFYLKLLLKKYKTMASAFYSTNLKVNKEYQATNAEIFLSSPWKNYVFDNIEANTNIADNTSKNNEVFINQADAVEAILLELKKIQERYDTLKPEIFAEDNSEFVERLFNTITLTNKLIETFKDEKIRPYKEIIDVIIKQASLKSDQPKIIRNKPLRTLKTTAASAKIKKIDFEKIITRLIYAIRDIASPIINFLNQNIVHNKLEEQFTQFMSILATIDMIERNKKIDVFIENIKNFTIELNGFLYNIYNEKSSKPKINLTQNLIVQVISIKLNELLSLWSKMEISLTNEQSLSANKVITEFKKIVIKINKSSLDEEDIKLTFSIFSKFQSSLFHFGELVTVFFKHINRLGNNLPTELLAIKKSSKNLDTQKVLSEVEMIVTGLQRNASLLESGKYARYYHAAFIESYSFIHTQKKIFKTLEATIPEFTNYFAYLTSFINEVLLSNNLMSLDTLTDLQLLYDMSMKPATLVQKTETREKYYTLVTDPLLKLIFEIVTVVKFTTTPHLNELSIDVEEQSSSCLSSDCTVSEATAFKEESATDQEIKALEKREKPRKKLSKFGFSQLNLLVPELTLNSNTRLVLTEKKESKAVEEMPPSAFNIARPSRHNSASRMLELFGRRGTISEETSSMAGSPRTDRASTAETPRTLSDDFPSPRDFNFFFNTEKRKPSENELSNNNEPTSYFI
ncbi:hypothetical protein [Legionella jamestowniensis]|uniref:Uncharacterized protein n=1 Tax=Legionella jamestowniensis TaxID=455 RepID=A0A0W0UZK4_9GAMM|nr:hypothetical protein [Legionella jamestowniensis]KTD13296.1 hypothetical protein Ljam_0086 [Legionella jamestowniensis]OCH98324.1 hypothetical protein A8135_12270 [Legionella jamestowniensis]SFL77502.1 hypothetical protein SAMN02746073_1842 [Legionella jamestowniensis DSM 19215]